MNFILTFLIKIFSITLAVILFSIDSSAQQIFIDSGQQFGNSFSWDVKLGDLDGDDDLDAVVANSWDENQKNEIWLNNGNATFNKSQQSLSSTSNVTLYDINADGHLDIIEHDWQSNSMKVWINDGQAIYTQSEDFPLKGNLILFDNKLNSLNQYEAVTLERRDSTILRIYSLDNGSILLKDSVSVNNFPASSIVIGDLNNDGYSDIVLGNSGPTPGPSIILFNDKNGEFTKSTQELGNYIASSVYLGDMNADGFLDILACNYHTPDGVPFQIYPAKLYMNDGNGNFTEKPLPYNSPYITPNAAIVDIDNDGDLDIYLNHGHQYSGYSHKSEILFNDGQANFTSSTVNLAQIQSVSVAFGDLDKDGDLDIFLACGDLTLIGKPNRVWLNTTKTSTGIKDNKHSDKSFHLNQNYPNPFNPSTVISYQLPDHSNVKLKIYDTLGHEIKTLVNSYQNAGEHSIVWNGTNNSNDTVGSGVYFYSLVTNEMSLQKKMVLVR